MRNGSLVPYVSLRLGNESLSNKDRTERLTGHLRLFIFEKEPCALPLSNRSQYILISCCPNSSGGSTVVSGFVEPYHRTKYLRNVREQR